MTSSAHAVSAITWHPIRLLQSPQGPARPAEGGFGLVILNQPLKDVAILNKLWRNSCFHIAADGGANRLLSVNLQLVDQASNEILAFTDLDAIIGDLDSISDEARNYFTAIVEKPAEIVHDDDQYSTDFSKAVRHVRSRLPGIDIVAMGGLGGRVDQGLSQLHHLFLFQTSPDYEDGKMYLVSGESLSFLLKPGKHRIWVRERGLQEEFGKYVGIVPVGAPSVISTSGLEWDVENWETKFGGQMSTSNHVLPETEVVEVETTADVIFTISLKRKTEGS